MKRLTTLAAFLVLVTATTAAARPFDDLFIRYEAQRSIYELAVAQMAQSRATRPEVRTYTATLVNDHEAYNDALRDLAPEAGE